jgi:hypothetical protein
MRGGRGGGGGGSHHRHHNTHHHHHGHQQQHPQQFVQQQQFQQPPRQQQQQIPCREWAKGYCPHGNNCRFYHDPSIPQLSGGIPGQQQQQLLQQQQHQQLPRLVPSQQYGGPMNGNVGNNTQSSQQPCRDWIKGYCPRGNACRFAHDPHIPQLPQQGVGGPVSSFIPIQQQQQQIPMMMMPQQQQLQQQHHQFPLQRQQQQQPSNTIQGGLKPCREWAKGYCPHGGNCKFAHDPSIPQLQQPHHQQQKPFNNNYQQQSNTNNPFARDRNMAIQYISSVGDSGMASTIIGDVSPREICYEVMRMGALQAMQIIEERRGNIASQINAAQQQQQQQQPNQQLMSIAMNMGNGYNDNPSSPSSFLNNNNMGDGWTNNNTNNNPNSPSASEQLLAAFDSGNPSTTTTTLNNNNNSMMSNDVSDSNMKSIALINGSTTNNNNIPPSTPANKPTSTNVRLAEITALASTTPFIQSSRTNMTQEEEKKAFSSKRFEYGKLPENLNLLLLSSS